MGTTTTTLSHRRRSSRSVYVWLQHPPMRPLLVFYLRSGIRVGLRSAAVLFGAFALFVIVQESPSEVVTLGGDGGFQT